MFHDVVEIMFRNRPGHKRITQRRYEITEDTEGMLVQDSEWEARILPGVWISMGIIITTAPVVRGEFGTTVHRCLRCQGANAGAASQKGSLKW